MEPSTYQSAIYESYQTDDTPIAVNAVPGAGKSTTALHTVHLRTEPTLMLAFNVHIVEHLRHSVPSYADVRTIHSLGYQALKADGGKFGKANEDKYTRIAITYLDKHPELWQGMFDRAWDAALVMKKLINFVRLAHTVDEPSECHILTIANTYALTCPNEWAEHIPRLLKIGAQEAEDNGNIDFTDMLHLPLRWNLPLPQYANVTVDECQDLSPAAAALVCKARTPTSGGLYVGDPAQSIMHFAGAGLNSFYDVKAAVGAKELPLSICYRCPTSHLDLARQLVPHIEARPDAPVGTIMNDIGRLDILQLAERGDMIICRNTAPLIDLCLSLIRTGKPARVRGRDIGKELAATIRAASRSTGNIHTFLVDLELYAADQHAKLVRQYAPRAQHGMLDDRIAGVHAAYASGQWQSIEHLITTMASLFSDTTDGIILSTVHRAKGLEAERVFILAPELLSEDNQQEANVKLVALTRSKQLLGFVHI